VKFDWGKATSERLRAARHSSNKRIKNS